MPRNPTKGEKRAYRDKLQHGQGKDLDPLSSDEIKYRKSKDPLEKERKEERRLDGSSGYEYLGNEKHGLGSPIQHDDHRDESKP